MLRSIKRESTEGVTVPLMVEKTGHFRKNDIVYFVARCIFQHQITVSVYFSLNISARRFVINSRCNSASVGRSSALLICTPLMVSSPVFGANSGATVIRVFCSATKPSKSASTAKKSMRFVAPSLSIRVTPENTPDHHDFLVTDDFHRLRSWFVANRPDKTQCRLH